MNNPRDDSFSVNDISPEHLNAGQAKLFMADIRRLLRYKNKFVYVPCPACGANSAKKMFKKYRLDYVICPSCETMYMNPRPTPELLEMYYKKSKNYWYWNKYIFPASADVRRQKIFRPRAEKLIDICKRYNVSGDTLLEVGSGFGIFCEEIKRTGFFHRVIGVEPTPDLAQTCRHKGLEIIEKPIEQASFENETINAIASFEVIEHLFCPRDFLKRCNSIVAQGGLIVLTCPNGKGFDISILGSISDAVDVEHLNYFNLDSISRLFVQCGFEVLEAITPGKLDAQRVRNAVLSNEFDISSHSFLKQILIDNWDSTGDNFQQFLADNKLSSHMWIVGRKHG